MNRLIDKTLNSLFKLAERLTGTQAQPTTTNSQPQKPQPPQRIRFTKADKWIQGELFEGVNARLRDIFMLDYYCGAAGGYHEH